MTSPSLSRDGDKRVEQFGKLGGEHVPIYLRRHVLKLAEASFAAGFEAGRKAEIESRTPRLVHPLARIGEIKAAVSERFGISETAMVGKCRIQKITQARNIAIWLCRALSGKSLSVIGGHFGGRDYSTIWGLVKRMDELTETDSELAEIVSDMRLRLCTREGAHGAR